MNQVGSKVHLLHPVSGTSLEAFLSDQTDPYSFFSKQHEITKSARQQGILEFLDGSREVPQTSVPVTETRFYLNWLNREREVKVTALKARWFNLIEHDPCLSESLLIQNSPGDPNPLPQGKPKTSQEAAVWRQRVPVSKSGIRQYIGFASGGSSIEGPEHPASRTLVQENVATCYYSVYSDGLSEAEQAAAEAARPLDSMTRDVLVSQEAENCLDIPRPMPGDTLDIVKSKIHDLTAAEKAFHESASRSHKNHSAVNDLHGKIETFVNKCLPVAQSLCPQLIVSKDWPGIWNTVQTSFISKMQHHGNPLDDSSRLPMLDSKLPNIASFKKELGQLLAEKQCMSQERHVGTRGLGKVNFLTATTDCFLSDTEWITKYPPPQGAIKETKDATVRGLMQASLSESDSYSNRLMIELRSNPDCTPSQLLIALAQEEILLKPLQSTSTRVNSVQQSSADSSGSSCDLHGQGHATAQCKMLNSGTVIYNDKAGSYVYKDGGKPYRAHQPPSGNKSQDGEPQKKKVKYDNKSKGKTTDKKKEKKEVPKDNKKEKDKKKYDKKIVTAIAGLQKTMVSMIQQSSSTPTATSTQVQATAPVLTVEELDKRINSLKTAIGLPIDP